MTEEFDKDIEKNDDINSVEKLEESFSTDNDIDIPMDTSENVRELETFEQSSAPLEDDFKNEPLKNDFSLEENLQEDGLISVRPVKFEEFNNSSMNLSPKRNFDIMQDIPMHVSVELGKTKLSIKEVMEFKHGSILELDKIAGEQVEIYVNKKLVAKGEVIVIEDKFGVRVVSTNLPKANV